MKSLTQIGLVATLLLTSAFNVIGNSSPAFADQDGINRGQFGAEEWQGTNSSSPNYQSQPRSSTQDASDSNQNSAPYFSGGDEQEKSNAKPS